MNPLVSICCITYNHELYIRECLDGFLMQKTNFLFEILIHDDASTDNTSEIIREYEIKYPEIIKPIYQKENQYSKGIRVTSFNFNRSQGKYIAMCEGDDYWIDPLKLQKQVDFLEMNPGYGLVHTNFNQYFVENKEFKVVDSTRTTGDVFIDLLKANQIGTLTTLFRKSLIESYPQDDINTRKFKMGDYPLWLYIAKRSKIGYLDEVTSVYRILIESASNSQDKFKVFLFEKSVWDIRYYYANNEKQYLELLRPIEISFYRYWMKVSFDYSERRISEIAYAFLRDHKQVKLKEYLFNLGSRNRCFRDFIVKLNKMIKNG